MNFSEYLQKTNQILIDAFNKELENVREEGKKKLFVCSYEDCDGFVVEKDEDGRGYCREHYDYLKQKVA